MSLPSSADVADKSPVSTPQSSVGSHASYKPRTLAASVPVPVQAGPEGQRQQQQQQEPASAGSTASTRIYSPPPPPPPPHSSASSASASAFASASASASASWDPLGFTAIPLLAAHPRKNSRFAGTFAYHHHHHPHPQQQQQQQQQQRDGSPLSAGRALTASSSASAMRSPPTAAAAAAAAGPASTSTASEQGGHRHLHSRQGRQSPYNPQLTRSLSSTLARAAWDANASTPDKQQQQQHSPIIAPVPTAGFHPTIATGMPPAGSLTDDLISPLALGPQSPGSPAWGTAVGTGVSTGSGTSTHSHSLGQGGATMWNMGSISDFADPFSASVPASLAGGGPQQQQHDPSHAGVRAALARPDPQRSVTANSN
ncbi:hypothetical protein KEM52_003518, partial [Ascosphaera acerosa]